jgi:competence protein ComEA
MKWLAIPLLMFVLSASSRAGEEAKPTPRKLLPAPVTALDINQATVEDLAALPGIGPKLAGQIVAYREKHGPFCRVEDLLAIRGIGPKKWKAIRPYLRVDSGPGKGGEGPLGSKQ